MSAEHPIEENASDAVSSDGEDPLPVVLSAYKDELERMGVVVGSWKITPSRYTRELQDQVENLSVDSLMLLSTVDAELGRLADPEYTLTDLTVIEGSMMTILDKYNELNEVVPLLLEEPRRKLCRRPSD
jgi:hypothetical protein